MYSEIKTVFSTGAHATYGSSAYLLWKPIPDKFTLYPVWRTFALVGGIYVQGCGLTAEESVQDFMNEVTSDMQVWKDFNEHFGEEITKSLIELP